MFVYSIFVYMSRSGKGGEVFELFAQQICTVQWSQNCAAEAEKVQLVSLHTDNSCIPFLFLKDKSFSMKTDC